MSYGNDFYANRYARTVHAAEVVLEVVLPVLPLVRSAVDIGCGVGTWLSVLQREGVADIRGVDGPWVDPVNLAIPADRFSRHDLATNLDLGRRFDLAISVEVAEHLPPGRAAGFVGWLADLSDFVLFSAAIPLQGGRHHFNEQWPDYWVRLFAGHGYEPLDLVRCRIWDDDRVDLWYRQNLLLYVRSVRLPELQMPDRVSALPLNVVHPDFYLTKLKRAATVGGAFKAWRRRLRDRFRGGRQAE